MTSDPVDPPLSNEPVEEPRADELKATLEKYTNAQLLDLVKRFDISFKDRSKASKPILIRNLLENVGPHKIPPARIAQELQKLPPPGQKRRPIAQQDFDDMRAELRGRVNAVLEQLGGANERFSESLGKIQQALDALGKQLSQGLSYSSVSSAQAVLKAIRETTAGPRTAEDLDTTINDLMARGFRREELAKTMGFLSSLDSAIGLTRKLSWAEDLDGFYQVLKREFESLQGPTGSGVPIGQIREVVCRKTSIVPAEFDEQLAACFRRGWLNLDFRSPIGEKPLESIDISGKEYQVIRGLKRS